MAGFKIEGAIITVGMLVLERIPRNLLVAEWVLEDNYAAALQEFQDVLENHGQGKFEPPADFRQRVLDHLRWYLEDRGYLS